jgi:hypothetical protein
MLLMTNLQIALRLSAPARSARADMGYQHRSPLSATAPPALAPGSRPERHRSKLAPCLALSHCLTSVSVEPRHFDLVAVGGGLAGIMRSCEGRRIGAAHGSARSRRQRGVSAINRQTGGEADQELAAAMKHSARSNGRCWCSPGLRTNPMPAIALARCCPIATSCSSMMQVAPSPPGGRRRSPTSCSNSSSGAISSSSAGRAAWLFSSHIPAFASRSYDDLVSIR